MRSGLLKSIRSALSSYNVQTVIIVVVILASGVLLTLVNKPKPASPIQTPSGKPAKPTPSPSLKPTPSPTPTPTPTPALSPGTPPSVKKPPAASTPPSIVTSPSSLVASLLSMPLFVEPGISAASQAAVWDASRPGDAVSIRRLAAQPQAKWLGDWNSDPYEDAHHYVTAAAASKALPVLTLYNLPNRDCGSYSGGGAASKASYLGWIERVSVATGQLPVMIILEPDALAEMECFNTQQQADLYDSLRQAVYILKRNSRAAVYLDAGHPHWQSAATMVGRLNIGGIAAADGFSLNVSNFIPTTENIMYGLQISAALGGKHFVIDTSRNGAGSNGEWCNPPGRALGAAPTARTGVPLADAFLWIKTPGESDGDCGRGEPVAGVWWPDYALGLAQRAGY